MNDPDIIGRESGGGKSLPKGPLTCARFPLDLYFFRRPKRKLPIFMRPTGFKKFILMKPAPLGREAHVPHGNDHN
jgi:hypothetical protein